MRVFLAGAGGVIGMRLVPLLVSAGHDVAGLTRTAEKMDQLADLGAVPIVADVFDAEPLARAVVDFRPDLVLHQLTDLPDDPAQIRGRAGANARIRREGTANLLAAAAHAAVPRFLAQSIAWTAPGDSAAAVEDLERQVLAAEGVVLRYGQFYGPGTYYPDEPPPPPRIHIDQAAARTVLALTAPSGVLTVVDE